jgi:hypothetical protein
MNAEIQKWNCSHCSKPMYRTGGEARGIMGPADGEPDKFPIRPIVVVLDGKKRFVLCSKECLLGGFRQMGEEEMRGGYPLW